jgi:antitoxin (DNA-binding transcriptional repressor) of toxin-antitoxin stability system
VDLGGHNKNRFPAIAWLSFGLGVAARAGSRAPGKLDWKTMANDHPVAPGATIVVMARDITQRQLRNDSGEIMRGLDRGETFVVTRHGVPVGELTPLRRHRFVNADTALAMFRGAPSVDLARLRSDLDNVASQDPTPRA